jgi:predicted transcriptional regulator
MLHKSTHCPLCTDGKKYWELTSHIRCKHKITLQEFREKYPEYAVYTHNLTPYKKKQTMEE